MSHDLDAPARPPHTGPVEAPASSTSNVGRAARRYDASVLPELVIGSASGPDDSAASSAIRACPILPLEVHAVRDRRRGLVDTAALAGERGAPVPMVVLVRQVEPEMFRG